MFAHVLSMRCRLVVTASLLSVLAAGCASEPASRANVTRLKTGMSSDQVRRLIGPPDATRTDLAGTNGDDFCLTLKLASPQTQQVWRYDIGEASDRLQQVYVSFDFSGHVIAIATEPKVPSSRPTTAPAP